MTAIATFAAQTAMAPLSSADPVSPLTVVKTANPSPVSSGGQLTYTIQVTNTGGSKVANVVLTDQVNGVGVISAPPGLPQLTITSTKGSCTQGGPNGNLVTCDVGTVNGGQSFTVTIRGQVTASNGTTLNNTASVTGTRSAQTFTTSGSVSVPVTAGTGGGDLPDLTLNKTGPTSVAPGAAMAYTLTVNNLGTANTSNVRVVDTLPAGVSLTSTSTTSLFTCTSFGSPVTVTCDGGAVNQGQNATITLNATAPATTGTITNTAVVDPDNAIQESNELNNTSASVNTSVGGPPPTPLLSIAKTDNVPNVYSWSTGAGPDPVNPGQQLVYKIQVKNNATTRADDVVISDGTQGLEAASITASQVIAGGTVGNTGGCSVSAPTVTCRVRTLNPGGTITVTISGTVVSTAGASLFNTATVNGNIKNTGVTNTASEVTTVRPAIDLTITKSDSPDPACARTWPESDQDLPLTADGLTDAEGDVPGLLAPPVCLGGLTYRFVVGNSGNSDATNVVVRDPLPTGVILDSYDTDGGFSCAVSGQVVTCSGGQIPAAETRFIEFQTVAPPGVGPITNTATVDPNNAIFEADETNNTVSATTTITTGVDLAVWKSDSKDLDPPGDGAPTLVPGTSTDLGDGYDPIATRGTQTYTIYVDNVGTQDTTGIRLRDTLPADSIFLSVVANDPTHPADPTHGFTCAHDGSPTGGVVECVGGHLLGTESEFYDPAGPAAAGPGDDFATIKIRVFARATVGTMHNEVRVDPLNEIAEVNELNNLSTNDTVVTTGDADKGAYHQLTVVKTNQSPSAGTVATNGVLTYNLRVSNLGTDPVSNVIVQDTLPAGSRYISAKDTAAGSAAFFCSHDGSSTGGVVTCVGGDLDGSINTIPVGGFRDIRVRVFAPNAPGTITNQAAVDPGNAVPEGNEFDNDAQVDTIVAACVDLASCGETNAFYELAIDKTQESPANPVARNGIVTYRLKVSNLGSDPVFGVTASDRLPEGFRFIDAQDLAGLTDPNAFTCGGPDASRVLTCSGGSLSGTVAAIPGGAPTERTIEIRVFAPDTPGVYPNLAFVDPGNVVPEGNEFNNQDSVQTVVANAGNGPYIDLSVDKQQLVPAGNANVSPGGQLAYTLEVSNGGAGDAFNVTVVDVLPAHTTFFNAADAAGGAGAFTCAYSSGVVTCSGGTIPAGGSRTVQVLLLAPASIEEYASDLTDISVGITNQAFVDPLNAIPEGDETNNADYVDTTVKSKINLTVTKEGPDTAHQNDTADYVIKVKNNQAVGTDGQTAYGVRMVDPLPIGLIPLSVKAEPSNFSCQLLENPVNVVDCLGDLAPDQEVTITVNVFVTADGGPLDNEACVDPDHVIAETDETDNCVNKTTSVTVLAPNLLMNKSADASSVTAGQQFTYTLTVSNIGDGPTTSAVTVTDPLPSQVTLVNINEDAAFDCAASTLTNVSCELASLDPGAAASIQVLVTLNDGVTDLSFPNIATASGGGDPTSSSDTFTTFVGGSGTDLVLTDVSDQPDPVAAGALLTYTINVLNTGTEDSGAFQVTQVFDSLAGLTLVSAVGSEGFTCSLDEPTKTVTCGGSLLAGKDTTLTIRFTTDASAVPSVQSTVTVDSGGVVAESSEANNTDIETTTISALLCEACIDLVMGPILANPDPVANGDEVTWNFDVTNIGDRDTSLDAAPNTVVISVNVDGAFNEYTGLTASAPGFTCTVTPRLLGDNAPDVECTSTNLAAGAGTIVSVTATANTAATPSFLLFDAAVDPGFQITEFNEANNTGSRPVDVV